MNETGQKQHTAVLSISLTTINAVLRSGANHNCHIYKAGI